MIFREPLGWLAREVVIPLSSKAEKRSALGVFPNALAFVAAQKGLGLA